MIYTLTRWFPPQMRARAITRFYVSGPLSMMVMGAIAGTLLGLGGRLGLTGWQWLFLVEALPAILLGALMLAALPDSPETARWLRPEERDWLVRHRGRGPNGPARGRHRTGQGAARSQRVVRQPVQFHRPVRILCLPFLRSHHREESDGL